MHVFRAFPSAFALALVIAVPLHGQRDTSVAAGPQYGAGPLFRLLFGGDYRRLWTTPVEARVLDLRAHGGGLRPTTAGGGYQTKSLRFDGGDDYRYGFRSVDKDPVVPPELDDTFIEDIVRDQTRAQHPGAPAVAAGLLEAAGVLHTEPELVVLPDDEALGEHRARFAGTLGFLERRAVAEPGRPAFAGAAEILTNTTRELFPRLLRGPADRVDARAFLAARLMDVFMGDWDRHRGQWAWARMGDGTPVLWQPIPEDRDHAFVRFDGLLLAVARGTSLPQMVRFGPEYGDIVGQTWNGRDIDRWFLTPLDRTTWDSVAADLQSRLTDAVIEAAVRRLPSAWYALDGERLAHTLKARRDRLPAAAARFYAVLSRQLDLHATDAAELVTLERLEGGRLAVRVAAADPHGSAPYLARVLDPRETREVRLYLHGGADRVVVRGDGGADITVRLVGGGDTEVRDSSRAGGVRLYATGNDRTLGPGGVAVDQRAWDPPRGPREDVPPPRDWGRRSWPAPWLAFGPEIGVFAGVGGVHTTYGFRTLPFAWSWRWRAGWATTAGTGRVATDLTVHRANSRVHATVSGLVSGIEVLYWHGLGNETQRTQADAYYRVTEHRYALDATLVVPAGRRLALAVGPTVRFSDTDVRAGRILADSQPYGTGDFGQAGLRGELRLDTRDLPTEPTRGVAATLGGETYPGAWDVRTGYGAVHGQASAYLTARVPLRTTLALRAGGRQMVGTYPFAAAASIGDASTVRLGRQHRYAGDAAAWGNAELRVRLGRAFVLVPSDIGVFGLGDVGRVWVDGESSERWHSVVGGGLWLSFARPGNVLSLAVAAGEERTALYLRAGFAY